MKKLIVIYSCIIGFSQLVNAVPPVEWPVASGGNGHFYEAVYVPGGISWTEASNSAANAAGHLVTITSQAENDFVHTLIIDPMYWDGPCGPWIGGLQPAGSPEPSGGWQWVTGEPFEYSNWNSGQPNEFNGNNENRILFGWQAGTPYWNDIPDKRNVFNDRYVQGYIVEYNDNPDTDAQELVITSFEKNGILSWSKSVPDTVYLDVQWAPTLNSPWTNSWNSLTFITNTVTGSAEVPLFYRLVAITNVSDSVYGDWGLRTQSAVDAGYPDADHFFLKQRGNVITGTYWGEDPEDQNHTVLGSITGSNVVILILWSAYDFTEVYPGTVTSNNTYMSGTYTTSEGETDTWWAIRR